MMRTLILAAIVGLAALPACAFADPDKGESGKEKDYWKKQQEFYKDQGKLERKYWKEEGKRRRDADKRAWKQQREADKRAWERSGERRDYRPDTERYYEPAPGYDDYDEPRYDDDPPRLKGRGRVGPSRFEIWH